MLQKCYNTDLTPEEGKTRELAGKELAEDRVLVGLMIVSSSP